MDIVLRAQFALFQQTLSQHRDLYIWRFGLSGMLATLGAKKT